LRILKFVIPLLNKNNEILQNSAEQNCIEYERKSMYPLACNRKLFLLVYLFFILVWIYTN